ncbi:MAG: MazG-like family protein [Candidatus Nanoarchaeia archaeon]|jgi:NTP pyrophosphatase (non-canonical NTP hydrolase)
MKIVQDKVKNFIKNNNLETNAENHFIDLVSEIGEVGKELLKMSNYGRNKSIEFREEIKGELGDAFYSLISVANKFNVDLELELNKVLKKYEKRLQKGSAGSEND